jgi:hypothetical protein
LDVVALGVAVGCACGLIILLATNFLIYKGGDEIGPNLALLSHYFIGYEVTVRGSFVGLIYGFIFGFVTGSLIAFLRNVIVTVYMNLIKFKGSVSAFNDFIDNP